MSAWILSHEGVFRLSAFGGLFAAVALWEALAPRRARLFPRRVRWPTNLALAFMDAALLRVALPLLAVGAALWAERASVGLFHAIPAPGWLELTLSLLLLDLIIYGQHWAFHRVPLLWRLHRIHHADRDFDVTTALRFHPVEILLSMALKIAVVTAFGMPAVAVVLFEVLLNGMALFNHANAGLPPRMEPVLRALIVTPDMHRIHHSVRGDEHQRNFGFNLSLWDRLFGTYCPAPAGGPAGLRIGLGEHQDARPNGLLWVLLSPFRAQPTPLQWTARGERP